MSVRHLLSILLLLLAAPTAGLAAESLDCQLCHSFPGLSRLDSDTGELHLYFTSERHTANLEGPHARLGCTDCHERSELAAVPHEEVSPVDCTKACHVPGPDGVRVEFSHAPVAARMAASVHTAEAMGELPWGEVPPLREGQSSCLYCHDQPVLPDVSDWSAHHRGAEPTARCESCHDESLPLDVDYWLRHTAGRLLPHRPVRETARACALCHSNEEFEEHAELHDAVTSYFRSFHGRAGLLGDTRTAACMDCHRGDGGDPHGVLTAEDPNSRTHPENLRTTCRASGCHPDAVPELSEAGVHLRLDPDSMSPEYVVYAFFVLLIVGVMSLYYVLFLLEMLRAAFGRVHPDHAEDMALVRAVAEHPEGRRLLKRMTVGERVQHWLLVVFFVLLVLSGMPLKFATMEIMQSVAQAVGGLHFLRLVHHISGWALILVFLYHLGYLGRETLKGVRQLRAQEPDRSFVKAVALTIWRSPMMLRPHDVVQFAQLFGYLFGLRRNRPELPKYHFHHKFEYLAVFWGMAVIGLSGVMLFFAASSPSLLGGRAMNFAHIVHSDEAFLAAIYIVFAHMFAVMLSPTVFPLSRGSLTGDVPDAENVESHMAWVREVAAQLNIVQPDPGEPPRGAGAFAKDALRRVYAIGLMVGILAFASVTLQGLFAELMGGHAEVEVEHIALRLDAETLTAHHDDKDSAAVGGARRSPYQRGPLSHFHVIPKWYSPDPANSCVDSGCHAALPHGDKKENRAFLNMHTTLLDCSVCHREGGAGGDVSWVSLQDRSAQPAPAVLRLGALLEGPTPSELSALRERDAAVRDLLAEAIEQAGGDWELERWKRQLEGVRVGSEAHESIAQGIAERIGYHGRGQYGVKLGVPGQRFTLDGEQQAAAAKIKEAVKAGQPADQALVDAVHRGFSKPKVDCTGCHVASGGSLDFAALGYPQARAQELRENKVERYARSVEGGKTFFLPAVLSGHAGAQGHGEGEPGEDGTLPAEGPSAEPVEDDER